MTIYRGSGLGFWGVILLRIFRNLLGVRGGGCKHFCQNVKNADFFVRKFDFFYFCIGIILEIYKKNINI